MIAFQASVCPPVSAQLTCGAYAPPFANASAETTLPETVPIVDDEDGVRCTFQEWLAGVPNAGALVAEAIQQHAAGTRPLASQSRAGTPFR